MNVNDERQRGKLIAFEGVDGCGKSTQLQLLAAALRERGLDVVVTREPTDGPHGRRIREMARSGERVAPETELAWFMEDRRQHVAELIGPALAGGKVVLTDRYYLSSVAYQGARGLDWRDILERSEAEFPLPDLVIVVEVSPERGLERVESRGGTAEPVFEEIALQRGVAEVFAALACPYIARVPGDDAPEAVHRRVLEIVDARLGLLD
jgi:dTMP kinase